MWWFGRLFCFDTANVCAEWHRAHIRQYANLAKVQQGEFSATAMEGLQVAAVGRVSKGGLAGGADRRREFTNRVAANCELRAPCAARPDY